MVTTYNEKDLLSFARFVKEGMILDGYNTPSVEIQFKQWLYTTDKARFTVADLVSFGNTMMDRVQAGVKLPNPAGKLEIWDADIANWIHKGGALVNEDFSS
jgi:hypothetical protein